MKNLVRIKLDRNYYLWKIILFLILFFIPFCINDIYIQYILNIIIINIMLAIGLDLLTGFTGQFSVGHAAFFGIGAYSSALLSITFSIPFWFSFFLGGLFSACIGYLIGFPALRLSGPYLAMLTFGFGEITQWVFVHWVSVTKGVHGVVVPRPHIGSFIFTGDKSFYYIELLFLVILIILAKNIIKSKTGRAFMSIRDNEIASQSMGINIAKYKTMAFGLGAFYAGIAGSLYSALIKYISPADFGFHQSIKYLTMIVVGGLGSIMGSIIGATLLTILPELLRGFEKEQMLIYGALLLIFLMFMPQGIYGCLKDIINYCSKWKRDIFGFLNRGIIRR
jgi:branched-chain amino acid transport system permease protein